jgi:hypothetical protein
MNKPISAVKNQKEAVPFSHYLGIYEALDPGEIARRCGLPFDASASVFNIRIMGGEYTAAFPGFELRDSAGVPVKSPYEKILFLRYLCEGTWLAGTGKSLAYQEIPWGQVYYANFRGRCVNRFAALLGNNPEAFRQIMEERKELRAERLSQGDAGYRFEAASGFYMSVIVWAGDDEFPPAAQLLFDDNFVCAFTAEDLAVFGEVVLDRFRDFLGNRGPGQREMRFAKEEA